MTTPIERLKEKVKRKSEWGSKKPTVDLEMVAAKEIVDMLTSYTLEDLAYVLSGTLLEVATIAHSSGRLSEKALKIRVMLRSSVETLPVVRMAINKVEEAREVARLKAEKKTKQEALSVWRKETAVLTGEHGKIYLPRTVADILEISVKAGRALLLTGEPGVAKTDTARALAVLTGRKHFHLEVTGFLDPSQMEGQQYIQERNGASVTGFVPSAMLEAIKSAEKGEDVLLNIEEILRVQDPSVLNPLMHLLSHGEYHCTLERKKYVIPKGKLAVVATANMDKRYNFSGNSRRGVDDALADRFRIVVLPRLSPENLGMVLEERYSTGVLTKSLCGLWSDLSDLRSGVSEEIRKVLTLRQIFDIAEVGMSGFKGESVDIITLLLEGRTTVETLTALTTWVKGRGF